MTKSKRRTGYLRKESEVEFPAAEIWFLSGSPRKKNSQEPSWLFVICKVNGSSWKKILFPLQCPWSVKNFTSLCQAIFLCLQNHLFQEALPPKPHLESSSSGAGTVEAFAFACPRFPNSLLALQRKGPYFLFILITLNILSTSGYWELETKGVSADSSQKMN